MKYVILEAIASKFWNNDPYSSYSAVEALPNACAVKYARVLENSRILSTQDSDDGIFHAIRDYKRGVRAGELAASGSKFAIPKQRFDEMVSEGKARPVFGFKNVVQLEGPETEFPKSQKGSVLEDPPTGCSADPEILKNIALLDGCSAYVKHVVKNVGAWYPIAVHHVDIYLTEDLLVLLPTQPLFPIPVTLELVRSHQGGPEMLLDEDTLEWIKVTDDGQQIYDWRLDDAGTSLKARLEKCGDAGIVLEKESIRACILDSEARLLTLKSNQDKAVCGFAHQNRTIVRKLHELIEAWIAGRLEDDDDPLFTRADLIPIDSALKELSSEDREGQLSSEVQQAIREHANRPSFFVAILERDLLNFGKRERRLILHRLREFSPTLAKSLATQIKGIVRPIPWWGYAIFALTVVATLAAYNTWGMMSVPTIASTGLALIIAGTGISKWRAHRKIAQIIHLLERP